jgi:hypothetical protein
MQEDQLLTAYIRAAMHTAHYEIIAGAEGYLGKIPGLQGVWANAGNTAD